MMRNMVGSHRVQLAVVFVMVLLLMVGCSDTPAENQTSAGTTSGQQGTSVFSELTVPKDTVPPEEVPITPPDITVSSQEELCALVSGGTLENGNVVCITQAMEITADVVFSVPVTLRVEQPLQCEVPIVFDTRQTGRIEIQIPEEIDSGGVELRFNAPCCDVVWENGEPYGSEELAAAMTNVRSYNGVNLREKYGVGGEGTNEILSFTASSIDDLNWNIEGNVLHMAVSYLVSDEALKQVAVCLNTSEGAVINETMDLSVGKHYYSLSDETGAKRTYMITTERITYNLPVFYIQIENGQEVTSREEYLNATLRVDTGTAAEDFPGLDTTEILIRGRGHYSWKFDKKPYKLRFEKKTSVLGMAASKNWTLIANYTDRSLIQNHVALEMGKVMDHICYHSTQYPVDVFVNGSYRGVYTFGEQLEAKEERINLEESYVEPDTDYLLEVGGCDEGDVLNVDYFYATTLQNIAIKHPESGELSEEQRKYLIDYVKKADHAVCTLTDYEEYIDVDSVIDWVIIHELTYNLDCCFRRSCYLIKEKGGKLKMGPVWDFDLAFGSFYRYEAGDWATVGEKNAYVGITWMNYLKEDPAFMARFTQRWNEVKQTLRDTALRAVDEMGTLVTPSAEMNFQVWDTLGKSVPSQPSSHKKYNTYEKMLQRLRTFIVDRYDWLDGELNG